MNIVVAVRCYNEERHIERFMRCYDFADTIVVSDGGSTDRSIEILKQYPKVKLFYYGNYEIIAGHRWNPDAMHMNYVIENAKALDPDWLIFDDMDDVPNFLLQKDARALMETCQHAQINAFRLYMWGDEQYFPFMNRNFDRNYTSLWAWKPREANIHADIAIRHGTIVGTVLEPHKLDIPYCLLHKSWHPDTIEQKIERYNNLGLPMEHPLKFAGRIENLPEWARE